MKRVTLICAIILISAYLGGCAASLSKQAAVSSRSNVFSSNGDTVPIQAGQSDLNISASLKTHREFDCPINQQHSHGTPDYKLLINIDGQPLLISGELKEENLSAGSSDPEAGVGVRYNFRQKLRLASGKHQLIVSLPDDGIAVAREIVLDEKTINSVRIEPVYNSRSGSQRSSTVPVADFHEGIKGVKVTINGVPL
ncbi:hypothetical protein KI809_14805 [Geobacter pelophilus]|uniref:Lipoprotein n=1 Tax=Geoanaerobacter pelophilus TaxID=60036 RepID=A0AAW4LEJ4_9BACT|nr:hypothetical protein [Geoanaerobacter pelophilus]MBT0665576.1 hypothetical protein [Geoanaerobacter pelophilus]